jgi:hypothetical protein
MQSLEKCKKALDKLNTVSVGLSIDSVTCEEDTCFRINKLRYFIDRPDYYRTGLKFSERGKIIS